MDINNKIQQVTEAIKNDPSLKNRFLANPVKTIEEVTGLDLPDEQVEMFVEKVKERLSGVGQEAGEEKENLGDKLQDAGENIKDKAEDLGENVKDKAEDLGEDVKEKAEEAIDKIKGMFGQ